ncbi:MAG: NapC/NirT family cytochrome c [Wenzhouxiangellaceae bacterium]|nr:NapC/NirT family cytochrome c [Wenzhouxiangellaceae bacterium]
MNENGFWAKLWKRTNSKWLLGIPLGGFLALGVGAAGIGGVNTMLHATSTTEFCFACHSHEQFIRPEYEAASHFKNAAGVRAECADCHLPHGFFELAIKKVIVSKDIIPELMGKIDTQEKYDANRAHMAEKVWRDFKANDSKYCRHCHSVEAMDLEAQGRSTGRRHSTMAERGKTCIDCHYGIVHNLPENAAQIIAEIDKEFSGDEG